jgi:hypothetical protein
MVGNQLWFQCSRTNMAAGMSSGSAAMYGSDADDDSLDEQFEDWSST